MSLLSQSPGVYLPAEGAIQSGAWLLGHGIRNILRCDEAEVVSGIATYVIHRGNQALVYDTFPTVQQSKWVRNYLEQMGIKRFIVVNSHFHLDHVGCNETYRDEIIVASDDPDAEIVVRSREAISSRLVPPERVVVPQDSYPSALARGVAVPDGNIGLQQDSRGRGQHPNT